MLENRGQVVVLEGSVRLALEPVQTHVRGRREKGRQCANLLAERPLRRRRLLRRELARHRAEVIDGDVVIRVVREDLLCELLDPFLVKLRGRRMPPVKAVELRHASELLPLLRATMQPTSTLQTLPRPRSKRLWSEFLMSCGASQRSRPRDPATVKPTSNGFRLQLLPSLTRPRIEQK